ncbi:alpha/beta fold hydrolase [bacterium]|nr:alpha/beta fold hydrolase [bacterium]
MPRLMAFLAIGIGVVLGLRELVGSTSEAFWLAWPLIVLIGTRGLNVLPPPRLNSKSRVGRVSAIVVLALFPLAYYGFLVRVTGSIWSWRELLVISYFFGVSFELSLLYVFQFQESLLDRMRQRVSKHWHLPLMIGSRIAFYAVLIPYILVVFAVHRPKLLPTPMTGIPAGQIEPIEFLSRDGTTTLRGVFLKPKSPRGTVIVCHGVGANHADIEDIHLVLVESGFQVLTFDFRGHGHSDGHTITYGLNERLDVLGAYDACLARPDVDPERVFALGVSMGGASLAMALPEMPQVKAVVLDSAFASLPSMVRYQFRFAPEFVRPALTEVARGFGWNEIGADINSLVPARVLQNVDVPTLIIHGDDDHIVPVAQAYELDAACRNSSLDIERHCPHIGAVMINEARYGRMVTRHFLSNVSSNHGSGK